MKRALMLPVVLLVAVIGAACSDGFDADNPLVGTSDPMARLVGTWDATSFLFTDQSFPFDQRDLIAEGWRLNTVIGPNREFTRVLTSPEGLVTTMTGAVDLTGNQLVFIPTGMPGAPPEVFETQFLVGSRLLNLTNPTAQFDFGNGMMVPGSMRMGLTMR